MKHRKYPDTGVQVLDVDNTLWDVREARATKHGFDLLFGSPVNTPLSACSGLPRLIATAALRDYWEQNKTKLRTVFDLPAGRTTLKRVRRRLGFHLPKDTDAFFLQHIEDMKTLSPRQFGERYGIHAQVASFRRFRLLGRMARPLGWWQDEKVLEILRAPTTHRVAGAKLGIKTSHVSRLRRARLALDQTAAAGQEDEFRQAA
jgi:hypothetical protein